ncbi:hypothetical protein F5146DRAFT_133983 [Armillaria mellea]|nr:hypothetical protein F5146DRAFT_133983 [Armillaria mellea]
MHHTRNPTIPPPWVVICTFGPKFQRRTHKKSSLGFRILTSFPPTSFSLPVPFAMHLSFTVLSALFVTAWGSMLLDRQTSLPDCALPCITNVDYGSCSPSDNACLCKSATYVNTTTTCIESSCTGSDLTTAIATAQALCAEVGVTFSSTSLPTGAATSAGSSGSVAASTTASSSGSMPVLHRQLPQLRVARLARQAAHWA